MTVERLQLIQRRLRAIDYGDTDVLRHCVDDLIEEVIRDCYPPHEKEAIDAPEKRIEP